DLTGSDIDRSGAACLHVAATHVDLLVWIGRLNRRAQLEFQSFGCLHANGETAMTTQTIHDGDVDVGTAHSFSARSDNRTADDRGDVCCTTTDVYHRRGFFIIDRNTGADSRRLSFFDHVYATDARFFSSGE